ncbi:MAG: hypothetical protein ACYSR7_03950, partial [Planctomycetota bacterium]
QKLPHKRCLVYQQKNEDNKYEKLSKLLVCQENMFKKENDKLKRLFINPQSDLSKESFHLTL